MKNGGLRLPSRYFENKPTKPCRLRRLIFDQAVGNTKCIHIFLLQTKEAGAHSQVRIRRGIINIPVEQAGITSIIPVTTHQGNPSPRTPCLQFEIRIACNLNLFCFFVYTHDEKTFLKSLCLGEPSPKPPFVLPSSLLKILLFARSNNAKGRGLGTPGPPL
jgi:hypothetical protein